MSDLLEATNIPRSTLSQFTRVLLENAQLDPATRRKLALADSDSKAQPLSPRTISIPIERESGVEFSDSAVTIAAGPYLDKNGRFIVSFELPADWQRLEGLNLVLRLGQSVITSSPVFHSEVQLAVQIAPSALPNELKNLDVQENTVFSISPRIFQNDLQLALQEIREGLRTANTKLDKIDLHLAQMRTDLLLRFDQSDQQIITSIVKELDENNTESVQLLLDALDANKVSNSEMDTLLEKVQNSLAELELRSNSIPAPLRETFNARQVFDHPKFDVKHKLKVAAPIIPFVLSYEAEIALSSGGDLKAAWEGVVARLKGTH